MGGWAAFHLVNVGKKTRAEEEREKEGKGELYSSTVFLNCISNNIYQLYFSIVYFLDWTSNVGEQTSEEEEGKENIELEEDETRVKLPFRCLANLLFRSWCLGFGEY